MAEPVYTPIPGVPTEGLPSSVFQLLNAYKDNIELLTGLRGGDASSQAIARGSVTTRDVPAQRMTRVTADGAGFAISGERVASLDDYNRLRQDVQTLSEDVAGLSSTLQSLLNELRA
jgi:hypothetical protein